MTFSENLKSLRTAKGISQEQMGEQLNVSLKTVSHWETGYSEPSMAQLVQLADYFDISLDDLVGRKPY